MTSAWSSCPAGGHHAHGRIARPGCAENLDRLLQMANSPFAARIIQGHHQVGIGGRPQTPADRVPGNEQVAEADYGEIKHQRGPQGGGGGTGGRHAGNDLDGNLHVVARGQFERQPGHAVNAGIAGGNQCHHVAGRGPPQGLPAAFDFLPHARGNQFFTFDQIGDRRQVRPVADNHAAFRQGLDRPKGTVLPAAGTDTNDKQFASR